MQLRSDAVKVGVARAPHRSLLKADGLTDEEMSILLPDDSNRPQWNNMVQWARKKLVDYKYLHNAKESGLGIWKLTQDGIKKQSRFLQG